MYYDMLLFLVRGVHHTHTPVMEMLDLSQQHFVIKKTGQNGGLSGDHHRKRFKKTVTLGVRK